MVGSVQMSHVSAGDELAIVHKVAFRYLFDSGHWHRKG